MATTILIYPHEAAMIRKAQIEGCIPAQIESEDGPQWNVEKSAIDRVETASKRVLNLLSEKSQSQTPSWRDWAKKNVEYYTATGELGAEYLLGIDLQTLAQELKVRDKNPSWLPNLAHYLMITGRKEKGPWDPLFYRGTYPSEIGPPQKRPKELPQPAESMKLFAHEAQILRKAGLKLNHGLDHECMPIFRFWASPREIEEKATALESQLERRHREDTLIQKSLSYANLSPDAEEKTLIKDLRTLAKEVHARRVIPNLIGQLQVYNLITACQMATAEERAFYDGDYRKVEIIIKKTTGST